MNDGAIIAWSDGRDGLTNKTYAQRVGDEPSGITEKMQNNKNMAQNLKLDIHPCPFSNYVRIELNAEGNVIVACDSNYSALSLKIYDITGQLVRYFINSGTSILWSGNDDAGLILPNGIYFIKVDVNGKSIIKKIVKTK
jgi:flagellar hook assembly protein FlgD